MYLAFLLIDSPVPCGVLQGAPPPRTSLPPCPKDTYLLLPVEDDELLAHRFQALLQVGGLLQERDD